MITYFKIAIRKINNAAKYYGCRHLSSPYKDIYILTIHDHDHEMLSKFGNILIKEKYAGSPLDV